MPNVRRRRPEQRPHEQLTDAIRFGLCYGPSHLPASMTKRDAAALWAEHRAAIMDHWISRNPGCRPWAWWCFDCPADVCRMVFRDEGDAARTLAARGLLTSAEEIEVQSGRPIRAMPWLHIADLPAGDYRADFLARRGKGDEASK